MTVAGKLKDIGIGSDMSVTSRHTCSTQTSIFTLLGTIIYKINTMLYAVRFETCDREDEFIGKVFNEVTD